MTEPRERVATVIDVERFLDERIVEREAESYMQGGTTAGQFAVLGCELMRLEVEIYRSLPTWLGRAVGRLLLKRLARREFGDHPACPRRT